MKIKTLTISVLLIVILNVACAPFTRKHEKGYEGPQLPPDQVAIVKADPFLGIRTGKNKEGLPYHIYSAEAAREMISLLPGEHSFNLSFLTPFHSSQKTIDRTFVLEAGKTYIISPVVDYENKLWDVEFKEEVVTIEETKDPK